MAEGFFISFLTSIFVSFVNSTFLVLLFDVLFEDTFSITFELLIFSFSDCFLSDLLSSNFTSGSLLDPCFTTLAEEKYLFDGLVRVGSTSSFVFEFEELIE